MLDASEVGRLDLPSIAVTLACTADHRWTIRLYAEIELGRAALVGELTTALPWTPGGSSDPTQRARLVALASCPGARRWIAEASVHTADGTRIDVPGRVELGASPGVLPPGIHPVSCEISGERYWVQSALLAAGANAIVILGGISIHAIHVWQDAAGAGGSLVYTDALGAAQTVILPATGGALTLAPRGTIQGPLVLTAIMPAAVTGGIVVEGLR